MSIFQPQSRWCQGCYLWGPPSGWQRCLFLCCLLYQCSRKMTDSAKAICSRRTLSALKFYKTTFWLILSYSMKDLQYNTTLSVTCRTWHRIWPIWTFANVITSFEKAEMWTAPVAFFARVPAVLLLWRYCFYFHCHLHVRPYSRYVLSCSLIGSHHRLLVPVGPVDVILVLK